jgi:hypothetical protein
VVDFGPGVILGETASRAITLSNEGALDVDYLITADVRLLHVNTYRCVSAVRPLFALRMRVSCTLD